MVNSLKQNDVDCQLETGNEQRSPVLKFVDLLAHPSTPTSSLRWLCRSIMTETVVSASRSSWEDGLIKRE